MKLWEAGKGRPAASRVGPRAAFARWSADVVWAVLLERTLGSHLCTAVRCGIGARRDWGPPWSRFPEPLPPASLASEEARAPASWLPRPEQPPLLRTLGTSDLPERWGDGLFAHLPDARRPWERQGDLCASHLCTAAQLAGGAALPRRGPGRPDSSARVPVLPCPGAGCAGRALPRAPSGKAFADALGQASGAPPVPSRSAPFPALLLALGPVGATHCPRGSQTPWGPTVSCRRPAAEPRTMCSTYPGPQFPSLS